MTALIKFAVLFLRFTLWSKRFFTRRKKIFMICPVRNADYTTNIALRDYVIKLKRLGYKVHYPRLDTKQTGDPIGTRICFDNGWQILIADEIHIWWDQDSVGSKFDFGMAFMLIRVLGLRKKVVLINRDEIAIKPKKDFNNVAHALESGDEATLRLIKIEKQKEDELKPFLRH